MAVGEIHASVEAARSGEAGKGFAMLAGDTSFIQADQGFAALIAAAFEQGLAAGGTRIGYKIRARSGSGKGRLNSILTACGRYCTWRWPGERPLGDG